MAGLPARQRSGAAVRLRARLDVDWDVLEAWRPETPPEVGRAVLDAVASAPREGVEHELLRRFRGASPPLRVHLLDVLASRAGWARRLLAALEDGTIPTAPLRGPAGSAPRRRGPLRRGQLVPFDARRGLLSQGLAQ